MFSFDLERCASSPHVLCCESHSSGVELFLKLAVDLPLSVRHTQTLLLLLSDFSCPALRICKALKPTKVLHFHHCRDLPLLSVAFCHCIFIKVKNTKDLLFKKSQTEVITSTVIILRLILR